MVVLIRRRRAHDFLPGRVRADFEVKAVRLFSNVERGARMASGGH